MVPPAEQREPRWSLEGVPELPGVYVFRGADEAALYVGKARNLRSRLASYRRPGGDGRLGVRFLERDAVRVETIVTRTESEALLLEDQLVKRLQPPHNVRLKDDKSFLMIRVDTQERFPRLKLVRAHSPEFGREGGRARWFGPFASSRAVRHVLSDVHRVVPLRDCTDAMLEHRTRACMKHQLGLCAAPCVGGIDEAGYATHVERALRILGGDAAELESELDGRMRTAAAELDFERAAQWRDRLSALRRTLERQAIRPQGKLDCDVLAFARRGARCAAHRLAFRGGQLELSRTHLFLSELPDADLVGDLLRALYAGGRTPAPPEIVLALEPAEWPFAAEEEAAAVRLVVPQGGERLRLLELAGENARAALAADVEGEQQLVQAQAELARLAGLEPRSEGLVIDCFDVSNLQGTHAVASRVRMRNGITDRAGYRRYRIRSVEGQDDFAAMREIVARSLRRGMREGDVPDLIVVDGGSAQLARALEARDEVGAWDVPILALAKARAERRERGAPSGAPGQPGIARAGGGQRAARAARPERLYLDPAGEAVPLAAHSALCHLLERLRDEAHRFAIQFHRASRGRIGSRLDAIEGIGPAKRKALLTRFGSASGVARASAEELAAVPGISRALAQRIAEALRASD